MREIAEAAVQFRLNLGGGASVIAGRGALSLLVLAAAGFGARASYTARYSSRGI